uniref:Uncharacterized protein n=2 Tax=Oryza meridionalis TaxID=40149 RepID=A0A0E0E1M6_9ORYZ
MEAKRTNKFFKEMSASIKATTADFNSASFSTPLTSSPPTERTSTKLLTFVTMDLPKVTPTNSSTICSSYDAKSDHTVAIVVTCVTSTVSSMELLSTDGTTGGTNINIPDSTKAMLTNCLTGGADHVRVMSQTMMGVPKGVLVPDASSEVSSLWLIAEMDLIKLMPSECLMKCLKGNNKLLGIPRETLGHLPGQVVWLEEGRWESKSYVVMHELEIVLLVLITQDPSDDKKNDLLQSAKHPFISYMMAQYFETIEQRRVSVGNSLDINIFQDTWGCKDGIQIILKEVENARDQAKCNQEYNFSTEECFHSNHQIILGN